MRESAGHAAARAWFDEQLAVAQPVFALAPQVLTEFIHVVTDPRRFAHPLSMTEAIDRAQLWWDAQEVKPVFPSQDSTRLTLQWLRDHRLGRKRLLDTQLAATYFANEITQIATSNTQDFALFGVFTFAAYT